MKLCLDVDYIVFAAASVMEESFIAVSSVKYGIEREFANRTEFYGEWRKKGGGWLAAQVDMEGNKLYAVEDFIIEDGSRLREFRIKATLEDVDDELVPALQGAKRLVDSAISDLCKKLGADSYFGYTGRGNVFRHDLATLLPYKGQRVSPKPLLLEQLKDYVIKHHNITLVTGVEADDMVAIATLEGYKAWKASGEDDAYKVVCCQIDKDGKGTTGFHHNPDRDGDSIREISGLGSLWLDAKGEVDGSGRMWTYYQCAVGDVADNYKSNCYSDVKYGSKGGYNDLKDCATDKQAFEALVGIFKKLYPAPKTVTTFRGTFKIDGMYVLQEMFSMALMLRFIGDKIDVKAVLDKMEVSYG